MGRGSSPGEFEQLVLFTLAGFDDAATAREVYEALNRLTERDPALAAVHITLSRIVEKGWAESGTREGDAKRSYQCYSLSEEGARLLADLRSQMELLWEQARSHPLLSEGGA